MSGAGPRIAILGFFIECNRFAPVTTRADFAANVDLRGEPIVETARSAAPRLLPDLPGFFSEMDRTGAWTPVPLRVAITQPGGPVEQDFFDTFVAEIDAGLRAAGPLDGVYVCSHGAALATGCDDADGEIYRTVRHSVGPEVPVVAVLDLHGNVSSAMVEALSALVAYRTNPHVDLRERGIEAARLMREMLGGMRPAAAMVKLPLVAPSTSLLTGDGPLGELVALGQSRVDRRIANVSLLPGFAYSDSANNGFAVVVTARDGDLDAARSVASEIADRAWAMRERFRAWLTPLDEAIARATRSCGDPAAPATLLADVADNPGGGGLGNTTWILEALVAHGARDALLGLFWDPALAAQAHTLGEGVEFVARFNRAANSAFSRPFETRARVLHLCDGRFVGRRGLVAGTAMTMGPSALLAIGGVRVAVISNRQQCLDPAQLEVFGVDLAGLRVLVVKSRGHFRAAFDEHFGPGQIVEVDCPGLTSPVLGNFRWQGLPRPVFPLDPGTRWHAST